jgi:hypothetical protein
MYDAIHQNVAHLPNNGSLIAGYVTGTPDIRWTPDDWAKFPSGLEITIDQGSTGSPVYSADVVDVEPGAWEAEQLPGRMAAATVKRPTVYCDLSSLPDVLAVWHGDLWLAVPSDGAPSLASIGPLLPDIGSSAIIGVQWNQGATFDTSIIYDPYWPLEAPVTDQFTAPTRLDAAPISVSAKVTWDAVPDIGTQAPTGYTVVAFELNGDIADRQIVTGTEAIISNLHPGWDYKIYVWANGGNIAPPHAVFPLSA